MELCGFRGGVSLVGRDVDIVAAATLNSSSFLRHCFDEFSPSEIPYHITLLTKAELRSLIANQSADEIIRSLQQPTGSNHHRVHYLGLGGVLRARTHALFVVCIWAKGQELRSQLGLPPKHFHITLSSQDVHDVDKGISSLFTGHALRDASPELLDHLAFTLHSMQDYTLAKAYAGRLSVMDSSSEKGFLRLGDVALKTSEYKLAMLAFACAFERCASERAKDYCQKRILVCAKETEWGAVFSEDETSQLPDELKSVLVKPWSTDLRALVSTVEFSPSMCRHPREQICIPASVASDPKFYKIPRYFRWLVPFRIALMAIPKSITDVAALASPHIGIRHVVTLTEEMPLPPHWFPKQLKIRNTFVPVPDHHPLSVEQIDLIVQLMRDERNLPMLIHCAGGKGRTGVVAACYIAAFGFAPIPTDYVPERPMMSAPEAISRLRAIRPISIETKQQEACVGKWCSTIWKRRSVFPQPVSEPASCPLEVEGTLKPEANLYVLVGLPGAGKSWTAGALLARKPEGWRRVSQDDSGSRSMCENEVGHFSGMNKLILDRCNTSKDDRQQWLALAAHWSVAPVCVSFEYDMELCTSRAQTRVGHPTLPPGSRVRSAIEQMHGIYVNPSLGEGFAAVVRIRSFAAAEQFVERVSPAVGLLKFPRTEHLLNLGAATSDDLVSDHTSLILLPDERVVITEKIDGANMGFSLSADNTRILVQNRSHYVHPDTHEQFKKLGQWIDQHREDLYHILDRDPMFPQRYILYGEWMAATHSVAYNHLPDWFLGFDLYDRSTAAFVDRAGLEIILAHTDIQLVPVLHQGEVLDEVTLRGMVQTKSQFCDGSVEGVYVKVERAGKVVSRGKVVRGDFISGNEHWTQGGIRLNQLRRETHIE